MEDDPRAQGHILQTRWDHARLIASFRQQGLLLTICSDGRAHSTALLEGGDGPGITAALSDQVAQLGQEGWHIATGYTIGSEGQIIWLKRPASVVQPDGS